MLSREVKTQIRVFPVCTFTEVLKNIKSVHGGVWMLVIYLPTFSKTQELQIEITSVLQRLSLKRQTKIAADDTLIFLLLSFEENKA